MVGEEPASTLPKDVELSDIDAMRDHLLSCKTVSDSSSTLKRALQRLEQAKLRIEAERMREHILSFAKERNGEELNSEEVFVAIKAALVGIDKELQHDYITDNGDSESREGIDEYKKADDDDVVVKSKISPPLQRISPSSSNDENEKNGKEKITDKGEPKSKPRAAEEIEENMDESDNIQTEHEVRPQSKSSILKRVTLWHLSFFRTIFLDIPVIILFSLFVSTLVIQYIDVTYLDKLLPSLRWTELRRVKEYTYYNRFCSAEDISTSDPSDLVIRSNWTTGHIIDNVMRHGASLFEDLLQPETAKKLRDFTLKKNEAKTDPVFVLANDNRWSFAFGANDDPIIPKALEEITTNVRLRSVLEKMLGNDPAVVEMQTITAAYGAEDQFWHSDLRNSASYLKFGRTFLPHLSIFVPLQDTTPSMGATAVCPGTHYCDDVADSICDDLGFQMFNPNQSHRVWKAGHGLLLNQQTQHRGVAHTMQNGPNRAIMVVTFVPRPQIRTSLQIGDEVTSLVSPFAYPDTRMFSQGIPYSLRFDMYGHTLSDLSQATKFMAFPLTWLRSLHIWKPKGAHWGWDYLTVLAWRVVNEQHGYYSNTLIDFLKEHWLIGRGNGVQDRENDKSSSSLLARLGLVEHLISDVPKVDKYGAYIGRGHGIWHIWALETVLNCQYWFGLASGVLVTSYILAAILYAFVYKIWRGGAGTPLQSTLKRLLWIHASVLLFAGLVIYNISSSPWGQFIASPSNGNRMLRHPFSGYNLNTGAKDKIAKNSNPTTEPHRSDVLFGTRYHSCHLHMLNSFLDHHPGNVRWQKAISDYTNIYTSYCDYAGSRGLPQAFVENLMKSFLTEATEDKSGRVLSQNATSGDWHILPIPDVKLYAARALRLDQSSVLERVYSVVSLLETYNAIDRANDGRAMSKFSTIRLMLLRELFDDSSGIAKSYSLSQPATLPRASAVSQVFPFVKKSSLPARIEGMRTQSVKIHTRVSVYPNGNEWWFTAQSQSQVPSSFDKGDVVECKYENVGKWFRATITAVHHSPLGKNYTTIGEEVAQTKAYVSTYDVEYTDGDIEKNIDAHLIKQYRPLKEGDIVFCALNQQGAWQEALIMKAYVTGTFDLRYKGSGENLTGVRIKDLCWN